MNKNINEEVTIFFPTRNRPEMVLRTLENIIEYCPEFKVLIANCSSKNKLRDTKEIIDFYNSKLDIKEVIYDPDPGVEEVYSDLFLNYIKTEFALLWADDVLFLKKPHFILNHFLNFNINLIGLPMVDEVSFSKTVSATWPIDHYGCVLWNTPSGRCANHTILRVSYFQKFDKLYNYNAVEYIDGFVHNHTTKDMRVWPNDGAYIWHSRVDDETRFNMIIADGNFRFPIGHKSRGGEQAETLEQREKNIENTKYNIVGLKPIEEISSLIRNKKVALVGPASYLSNYNLGNIIDSYDIVCRIEEYFTGDTFINGYGNKTDIVFDNCDTRANEETILKMQLYKEKIKEKIKLVILHDMFAQNGFPADGELTLKNWNKKNILKLPYISIGVDRYKIIKNILNMELNSGVVAMILLLAHEPKELLITGFSFYLEWDKENPYDSTYKKDYVITESLKGYMTNNINWAPYLSHKLDPQINYFKLILLKQFADIITIDSYMKKILNVDYNKVIECK
jgi:hypothetical protein